MTVITKEKVMHQDNPHLGNRNETIKNNLRLVHKVCQKYKTVSETKGIDYEDIFQVGVIGLIKAYEKFDPTKFENVTRFSTYAVPMIQGELQRMIRDHNQGAKFSRRDKEIAYWIFKNDWYDKTPEEISKLAEVPICHVERAFEYMRNGSVDSMDRVVFEDDGNSITLQEQLPSIADYTSISVQEFLSGLQERDKLIVKMLMQDKRQEEIGETIGISQAQVSRIVKKLQVQLSEYMERDIRAEWAVQEERVAKLREQKKDKHIKPVWKTKAESLHGPVITYTLPKEEILVNQTQEKGDMNNVQNIEKNEVIPRTKENYERLRTEGKTNKQIAIEYFGMKSDGYLYSYLEKWGLHTPKSNKRDKKKSEQNLKQQNRELRARVKELEEQLAVQTSEHQEVVAAPVVTAAQDIMREILAGKTVQVVGGEVAGKIMAALELIEADYQEEKVVYISLRQVG